MIKFLIGAVAVLGITVIGVPLVLFSTMATAAHLTILSAKPTDAALADVPPYRLNQYLNGGLTCDEVPWTVLAAVGKLESDHGRSGPFVFPAAGEPDLPAGVIVGGPQDSVARVNRLARFLCDQSDGDLQAGLTAYNPDPLWVDSVFDLATSYGEYRETTTDDDTTTADTPPPDDTGHPTGPVSKQETTVVGGIRVHTSIAQQLTDMLAAARTDGVYLTGGGWRDPAQQIALREAHCGTSHYAIYDMPSKQCTPDTARPGRSMHERGLAIDFNNCAEHKTACWQWLHTNAARYGFINLINGSEPWHWSTNGN